MTTIKSTDVIFATVIQRGVVLASLRLSGITSLPELLKKIMRTITGAVGITTIDLRNGSQGWQQRRTIMLTAA